MIVGIYLIGEKNRHIFLSLQVCDCELLYCRSLEEKVFSVGKLGLLSMFQLFQRQSRGKFDKYESEDNPNKGHPDYCI